MGIEETGDYLENLPFNNAIKYRLIIATNYQYNLD